jgi:amino-acid N-acetyltransferase
MPTLTAHSTGLDSRLAALAEPTRRLILERLADGETCVCDLQDGLGVAQSRLSFHLKKLKDARLVRSRRQGRWVYYELHRQGLTDVAGWIGSIAAGRPRSAATDDLPGMLALLTESGLPISGVSDLVGERDRGGPGRAWVSGEPGSLEAMAALEIYDQAALLRSVAVAPGSRRRGLGRVLVGRALREASLRGCTAVYLLTTTAEDWFGRQGFGPVSREAIPDAIRATDEFTHICPSSAVAMSRLTDDRP